MFFVYVLKNENKNRYYIGSTSKLEQRLNQHSLGKNRTTRVLKTDKLVYFEEFETKSEALKRERKLKSYKSKKYLEWLIKNGSVAQG